MGVSKYFQIQTLQGGKIHCAALASFDLSAVLVQVLTASQFSSVSLTACPSQISVHLPVSLSSVQTVLYKVTFETRPLT